MLVAKEMSISRAAQKAFVSQQCVSDRIKRMEQHYEVKLVTRKGMEMPAFVRAFEEMVAEEVG